ncbi:hypothetical protein RQY88_004351 [Vibrio vulnificus]|nr:hypothetical protein [Vibrio vulnificus]ELH9603000.1 hypothetical protein [Vibrio vulnificus]ELH9617362.1 hypothetical protein [Vibrio vulnificus]HAS6309364.1 hypothetical protein [Vibrio vulnificus]HDY7581061.1 hypothetical protein [Vibrio vulnificus]
MVSVSWAAITAFLVGALPVFKFLNDWLSARNQFRVKNLEFFYQCFESETNKSMKLVVEQQFKSVFKLNADFDAIEALLLSQKPSNAIQLFKKCKAYVVVKDKSFVLSEKYECPNVRLREYILKPVKNFTAYFVTAMPAVYSVMWLYDELVALHVGEVALSFTFISNVFVALIISITLTILAFISVTDTTSIKYADQLVSHYDCDFKGLEFSVKKMLTRRLRGIWHAWHF